MKLSLFLLVVCLQASASGWGQSTITLKVSNQPMSEVLKSVRKQAKMQFILVDPELKGSKPITLSLENASLKEALDKIFDNQPYTYTITDNVIVVQKRTPAFVEPIHTNSSDKKIDVKGKVMNEEGEPVVAASIRVKGTKEGTTTNENGEFNIAVDESAVLVISGVNIETIELRVNGRENVTVFAKMQISPMEEVVSKGYYKEKKLTNVGNVGKVTGDELQRQPVGNPLLGLQGRVAGLEVTQGSGMPGKAPTIRIRGRNSILNGVNPLYVIDGVPQFNVVNAAGIPTLDNQFIARTGGVANNQFFGLNSADIESIEVLKDGDATAIYGSKGANGVILITTKKGKAKGKDVEAIITSSYGLSKITNSYNLLNTQDYITMRKEAYRNDGISNYPTNAYDINGIWDTTRYTNWQDELIGNSAKYYDLQTSLSGQNGSLTYNLGIGYHKETTTFPGDFFDERKSVHLNLGHNPKNQRLSLNLSFLYTINTNSLPLADLTGQAISLPPNAPLLFDANNNINWENGTWTNPLNNLFRVGNGNNTFLNSNIDLSYKILNGLRLKINAGYNTNDLNQKNIIYQKAFNPASTTSESSINIGNVNVKNYSFETQLNYEFGVGDLRIQSMAGSSLSKQEYFTQAVQGIGFASDEQIENITLANKTSLLGVKNSEYSYIAGFARVNFNFANRYLLNLTGRRDGSSRFGDIRKFSNFYAVGGGWVFSETKFAIDNFRVLSHGKLRASYGLTGSDQIGDYKYLESFSPNTGSTRTYYGVVAMQPTRLVNPMYSWEKVEKYEGGVELGFWDDRLFITASYFYNQSSNQLLEYSLPITTGFPSVVSNLPATVVNKGMEFELSINLIRKKTIAWRLSGNVSFLRNKLTRFDGLEESSYATNYVVEQPLSIRKAYDFLGVNTNTGLYLYQDKNGDGIINTAGDRLTLIDPSLDYYGGLSNAITYKKLRLDFLFQFVRQEYGESYFSKFNQPGSMSNQPIDVMLRWQKQGDISNIQKFTTGALDYSRMSLSTAGYEDASYIRLKNVAISYDLISASDGVKGVSQLSLFMQAQNLLTISGYNGLDPENKGVLPPMKTLVVGIKAGF